MQVYLIEAVGTGLFKIGRAKDSVDRLRNLQTGNPQKLVIRNTYNSRLGGKIEIRLHKYFSYCRREGEWFLLPEDVVQNFISLCENVEYTLFQEEATKRNKLLAKKMLK